MTAAPHVGGGRGEMLPASGRTELGRIAISDGVIAKIAARAALDEPDAGAAATRVLGLAVPGAAHLGGRGADLDALPRVSVQVDGALAYVDLTISVRWPADIAAVAASVRRGIIAAVERIAGIAVAEVRISVADLVTEISPPPRVR